MSSFNFTNDSQPKLADFKFIFSNNLSGIICLANQNASSSSVNTSIYLFFIVAGSVTNISFSISS